MSTVRSRIQKGRLFQKRVMEKFKEVFELDDDDIRTPVGSENGPDVIFSKKAQEKVGIGIECKDRKSMNVWSAIEQTIKNTPAKYSPTIVFKRGSVGANKTWIIVTLDHYLELRKKILEYENDRISID